MDLHGFGGEELLMFHLRNFAIKGETCKGREALQEKSREDHLRLTSFNRPQPANPQPSHRIEEESRPLPPPLLEDLVRVICWSL